VHRMQAVEAARASGLIGSPPIEGNGH